MILTDTHRTIRILTGYSPNTHKTIPNNCFWNLILTRYICMHFVCFDMPKSRQPTMTTKCPDHIYLSSKILTLHGNASQRQIGSGVERLLDDFETHQRLTRYSPDTHNVELGSYNSMSCKLYRHVIRSYFLMAFAGTLVTAVVRKKHKTKN